MQKLSASSLANPLLHLTIALTIAATPALAQQATGTSAPPPTPAPAREVIRPPRLLAQVDPKYSDRALQAQISGTVKVYLTVDASGRPTNVRVTRGLGYGLDENAAAAVRQYKFQPATRDGQPTPFNMYLDVVFKIYIPKQDR